MADMDLIDTNEVVELLGITKVKLTQLKHDPKSGIPKEYPHKIGNYCCWERETMLAWIEKQPKNSLPGLDNRMAMNFLRGLYG